MACSLPPRALRSVDYETPPVGDANVIKRPAIKHPAADRSGRPATDEHGRLLWHFAAERGHPDVIQALLTAGVPPSARSHDGCWPRTSRGRRGTTPRCASCRNTRTAHSDLHHVRRHRERVPLVLREGTVPTPTISEVLGTQVHSASSATASRPAPPDDSSLQARQAPPRAAGSVCLSG